MIGKLRYKFRSKFEHGLGTWWYRDVVRPRILNSASVRDTTDQTCEIHVFTSKDDWVNLVWALKSFYHASGRKYALAIHEDGSLGDEALSALRKHFPDGRLILRAKADAEIIPLLDKYPKSQEFRKTNKLSPKVFDFRHYLDSERMLLLDSDVLFFSEPTELLRRIEDLNYRKNTVNSDVQSAYTVDPEIVNEKCGFQMIDKFNSGLGLIHRESMNLDWVEEFLKLPDIIGNFWRIEQTLYALFSSRFGTELLPQEYNVFLSGQLQGQPSRHYVGAVRHEMYREGIKRLQNEGTLER